MLIAYSCRKFLTVRSRRMTSPPPCTVSTVLATRLGVSASKSCSTSTSCVVPRTRCVSTIRVADEELEAVGGVRFRRPCCRQRSACVRLESPLLVAFDLLDVIFPVRREAEDGGAGTNDRRAAEDVVEIWEVPSEGP